MCEITEKLKLDVWAKATVVDGYDSDSIRKDACGAWIIYDRFGDKESIYGWEIDHIYPVAKLRKRNIPADQIDIIDNLRPLNWLNNKSKAYDYPIYHAEVSAKNDLNVRGDYQFEISHDIQSLLESIYSKYL